MMFLPNVPNLESAGQGKNRKSFDEKEKKMIF